MPKNYKKRSDVPAKYKWDLDFLLEGKTIEQRLEQLFKELKKNIAIKDSKYLTKEALLKYLKTNDKNTILINKIYNYLNNKLNENVTDPKINQLLQTFQFEMFKINEALGPELPRIMKHKNNIKKWIELPSFKNYKKGYEKVFEEEKHQLSKAIQEYRTKAARGNVEVATPFSILTDAELVFEDAIDSKGKKHKVNHATMSKLNKHNDVKLRKTASEAYKKAYLNVKETLSNFIFQHFKHATVEAKLRKFNSTIDYLVFDDRASEKLLLSLYNAVQKNVPTLKKAKSIHKKIYKARYGTTMTKYDFAREIVKAKSNLTIEEQQKLVLNSFKPFGKEYTDMIKKAFKEKWIDYSSYPGKRTGAYSIGAAHGLDKKLILMNDEGSIRSAETLAHELGHSMHTHFSVENNPVTLSDYKIFVAEIASIFNELMLFDYILNTSKDDKLKLQIMHQMVSGFDGTVFRQTEWSNYEYDMYKAIEQGIPVSNYTAISELYINNSKKYATNPNKKFKPEDAYSSVRVPHYYYGFYVYKYAIGQLVANIFFNRYKKQGKEALQDFIKNFLSIGGSLDPLETLKHNNIDLEDPKTYEEGFKAFKDNVKEYETLAKKVYGKKY